MVQQTVFAWSLPFPHPITVPSLTPPPIHTSHPQNIVCLVSPDPHIPPSRTSSPPQSALVLFPPPTSVSSLRVPHSRLIRNSTPIPPLLPLLRRQTPRRWLRHQPFSTKTAQLDNPLPILPLPTLDPLQLPTRRPRTQSLRQYPRLRHGWMTGRLERRALVDVR